MKQAMALLLLALFFACQPRIALAHITPPVVLTSDRDAIIDLLGEVQKVFLREVRLSSAERQLIRQRWHWKSEEDFYRFYLNRDRQGTLLTAVIFLTQFSIHGPIKVAVGLQPDGKIKSARVVELTEETFYWLKPVLDQGLPRDFVGLDSRDSFTLTGRFTPTRLGNMPRFYARIVASLMQRATILYEVTFLKRGREG